MALWRQLSVSVSGPFPRLQLEGPELLWRLVHRRGHVAERRPKRPLFTGWWLEGAESFKVDEACMTAPSKDSGDDCESFFREMILDGKIMIIGSCSKEGKGGFRTRLPPAVDILLSCGFSLGKQTCCSVNLINNHYWVCPQGYAQLFPLHLYSWRSSH